MNNIDSNEFEIIVDNSNELQQKHAVVLNHSTKTRQLAFSQSMKPSDDKGGEGNNRHFKEMSRKVSNIYLHCLSDAAFIDKNLCE